jgi:hypothetical protein
MTGEEDETPHLIQINHGHCAICQSLPHQERERQVTTNQAYFLVLVCGSFLVFAVSMGIAYAKYRLWLKQQPGAAD